MDRATGDVLVGDRTAGTISRYHADGTPAPFAALGTNAIDGKLGPGKKPCAEEPASCDKTPQGEISFQGLPQIAVDESGGSSDGNIYVTQNSVTSAYHMVDTFSAEGKYLRQVTAGSGGTLRSIGGVGVDSAGALYISGRWHLGTVTTPGIGKCNPSGAYPTNADCTEFFPLPENDLPEGESYVSPAQLAVGTGASVGSLFVAAETFPAHQPSLVKMDAETGEGGRFVEGYGDLVAVDPTSGNPMALSHESQLKLAEFHGTLESTEAPISQLFFEEAGIGIVGLATNSIGEAYAAAGGTHVYTYGLPAVVPTVTAEAAEEVGTTAATLTGTVNPEGLEVTECFFEWGANTFYGHTAPCEALPPTDSEGHQVTAPISGLTPNGTTYHYRLAARNENGLERSADETLATAHTVRTEAAEATGAHTATLNGTIRPEGTQYEECFFRWGLASNPGYEHEAQCDPEAGEISPATEAQAVRAELEGLQGGAEYRFRLVAKNPEGKQEAEELTFETWGPPKLVALRASGASQSTATLEAEIDPSGFDTSYRFEWGPTSSYGNVVPASPESLGSGTTAVRATQALSGLATATAYHYRVVAESSAGKVESPDQTLETLNSCGLPDGRCLEMVSPRDPYAPEQPGSFLTATEIHYQAATQGGALAYVSEVGHEDATRAGEILYKGSRGAGGWSSAQLSPPVTAQDRQSGTYALPSSFYGISKDLSCAVLGSTQPLSEDPVAELIVEAGGGNLYRRGPDGTYTLISDRPPETLKRATSRIYNEFTLAGMNEDCSRVYFSTFYRYAGVPGAGETRLYEWSEAGGLRYAGFVPKAGGGEEAVEATPGEYNAVSEDGSRLFFSAKRLTAALPGEVGKTGVFVREGGVSTDVSASTTATPDEGAGYQGATPDGSRVYFTANAGLTEPSSAESTDLYEYDLQTEALRDLSVSHETGGAKAAGLVAVSPDGSHAYLIARGQLVPGKGKTLAGNEAAETYSLYDYDSASEAVRFVATVSGQDVSHLNLVPQGEATSRTSPDGRYLLFEARGNLTGYQSGESPQAYLYDAEAGAGKPATTCVSCAQDGSASHNPTSAGTFTLLDYGGFNRLHRSQTLALRGSRPLVFFRSQDALAPGAVAAQYNLYEWAAGQTYLIAADAPERSFAGASADASDLYFFDRHARNWENPEARPEAWDARVGGGYPEPPPPPPPSCDPASEGSCREAGAAPAGIAGGGASELSGPGNVKEGAGKAKGAGRCTSRARQAKRLSVRARKLRRGARTLNRHGHHTRAVALARKARRLAKSARTHSKGAKRCRARVRKSRRSHR